MSFVLPGSEAQFSQYVSDPSNPVPYDENMGNTRTPEYMINDQRFVDGRTDVLTFTSPVLDQEVSVAGTIQVNLDVSISTTDADFVVKVIDVFPPNFRYADRPQVDMGGYQMLVRGDVFRGRYRKSYSHPEAFVPGEITPVEFPMPDLAHTFKKGHRIMVQIQSSWFPLVDMNPQKFVDIYKCSLADFVKSTVKVYHDANHPSQIVLPVVQ